ncbi:MAG: DUF364 domain-containing protein [Candidatus Adiutrix sp.]|jgi:uncharacterized protein (DUF4213/DUF364 family)|nr:DUF364 domain-containing protein [Candidatus Adiutrix sp.]
MTGADKWRIYDELLKAVPGGATVKNLWRGRYWLLLESSDGGFGLAQNLGGREGPPPEGFIGSALGRAAELIKSWDFSLAALGLAAVNAACNRPDSVIFSDQALSREGDAFDLFLAGSQGRRVAVIGRFPYLERLRPQSAGLTVLERNPGPGDLPDTAAEFILPQCDLIFITATALINKTLPRLLELGAGAEIALLGPSTPLTPRLFGLGLSALSGLLVSDPARLSGVIGESRTCLSLFSGGVKKVNLTGSAQS